MSTPRVNVGTAHGPALSLASKPHQVIQLGDVGKFVLNFNKLTGLHRLYHLFRDRPLDQNAMKELWQVLLVLSIVAGCLAADELPCTLHDGSKYYDLNPLKARHGSYTRLPPSQKLI